MGMNAFGCPHVVDITETRQELAFILEWTGIFFFQKKKIKSAIVLHN